jgi:inner membrane protein
MANFKEHAGWGVGVGIATYAVICRYYKRQFDFVEMLVCAAVATVAAVVPDVIEPALDPNHRSFAHSVAAGSGLLGLAVDRCGADNTQWDEWYKILGAVATAGYVSHLVLDGCTPLGLPLLSN